MSVPTHQLDSQGAALCPDCWDECCPDEEFPEDAEIQMCAHHLDIRRADDAYDRAMEDRYDRDREDQQ